MSLRFGRMFIVAAGSLLSCGGLTGASGGDAGSRDAEHVDVDARAEASRRDAVEEDRSPADVRVPESGPDVCEKAFHFHLAAAYFEGTGLHALVSADFNGDKKLDLAFINVAADASVDGAQNVTILLGGGDGTFKPSGSYPVGSAAFLPITSIATSDFNGDGNVDLAVANVSDEPGCISVLLGKGDGTFTVAPEVVVSSPMSVTSADFNGDGKPDLAVANAGVVVLLGNGDGTFTSGPAYSAGGRPRSVASADFNADGVRDLAVADADDAVSVLLGQGDGSFAAATRYAVGGRPSGTVGPIWIVTGDFRGNGRTDLAVADVGTDGVNVLLGNGDGTFAAGADYLVGGLSRTCVVAGDFDLDGRLDLAVTDNGVWGLLGKGDGTFKPAMKYMTGKYSSSLCTGDFNGDGRLDLAVAGGLSKGTAINILLNEACAE